jgi:hypothetical protein
MEYEKYKLCPTLKPRDVCIVLEQYEEGFFIRRFHKHVPASRISDRQDNRAAMKVIGSDSGLS